MNKILNTEQTRIFHNILMKKLEEFKVNSGWQLTDQMVENWLEGIVDFCDALNMANDKLTYEISTLRNRIEEQVENLPDEDEDDTV